jgi:hypothetical protein
VNGEQIVMLPNSKGRFTDVGVRGGLNDTLTGAVFLYVNTETE